MILERIGIVVCKPISTLLNLSALFTESARVIVSEKGHGGKVVWNVVLRQILFTGVEALKIVTVIALLLGGAVIIEAYTQIPKVGGQSLIGTILVVVIVRELAPLLTAFIIIGRSGTAISTEIGYMMLNHEVQAIEMMGINPLRFIVMPRIIGVAAAIFCLSFYFNVVALFGGYVFARLIVDYPFAAYLTDLSSVLGFWDIAISGIKCLLFGFIVATICCYKGFSVRFSFTEIPQMTTKAVVMCIYVCFVVNVLITALFFI
ncbi:MAG: ABC transporter permease [Pseudomonadota bacterium]